MSNRVELDSRLNAIPTVRKAYFQAPPNTQMMYPCIRYHLENMNTRYADDGTYRLVDEYQLIVIDPDPDSPIPHELMRQFRYIRMVRFYTADNLNHWVFTIYY